jgi:hypothetical protein
MSSKALQPAAARLYDQDFFTWTMETARLLRDGRFSELDIEHLAEEIEDMGKSEGREVRSRLRIILTHLLKWKWQPAKRSPSWRATLRTQRQELRDVFRDSPSLRRSVAPSLLDVYPDAIEGAGDETGLPIHTFPPDCPFTEDQVLDTRFLPD